MRRCERRMDSGKRPLAGEGVADGRASQPRSHVVQRLPCPDDANLRAGSACRLDGAFQQSLACEHQPGFIAAHARAFAAGQHKSSNALHPGIIRDAWVTSTMKWMPRKAKP